MVGKVIYNLLTTSTELTALIGNKVFPLISEDETIINYIVYERRSTQPTNTKLKRSTVDIVSYDIMIFTDGLEVMNDIALGVRNALDQYKGINSGLWIDNIVYTGENDDYEHESNVFGKFMSFDVRYNNIYSTLKQPTNLTTTVTASSIILNWTDNADGEIGYKIYRSTNLRDYELISTLNSGVETYEDTNLVADTVYYYYVVPYSSLGNGYASDVVAQKLGNITEITFTFDNNLIAVVDTSPYNIDCSTTLDVAIITDNVTFNGTYVADGTQNGQTKYVNTQNANLVIVGGAAWQVKDLFGITITQDEPIGQQYPYDADWSDNLTMTQATIEDYCGGTPTPCADATYTIKDSADTTLYSGSIASGGDLQQTITDSTVNVRKSDNTLISAVTVEAQATDDYLVSDSSITVNGNAYASVKATDSLDVVVEYENGTPVGTINGSVVEIPNPIVPSGIAYQRPKLTGQLTSYRTGDDAWRQINRPYNPAPTNPTHIATLVDNVTLAQNNVFGNTHRFTDQSGNQALNYPLTSSTDILTNNTLIDHYTGLEWGVKNNQTGNNKNWETAIDECLALNVQGFDDWYLPNIEEWLSVADFNGNGLGFNFIFGLGTRIHWSSTTDYADTTYATLININTSTTTMVNRNTKVTNRNYYPVRQRY